MLSSRDEVAEARELPAEEKALLRSLVREFGDSDVERVKAIERQTRHDVKAVEYYLKEQLKQRPPRI